MRDAAADIGRRAWTPCPRCADDSACSTCKEGRSCEVHWRYLLGVDGRMLFLQCRSCWYRWWHDTGFGVGVRSA
jgi:hypothetical protein